MARATSREKELIAHLAGRRARPGTAANLGADAFLAALAVPEGFARALVKDGPAFTWKGEPAEQWPAVVFTGHGGQTTVKVVLRDAEDEYSPGTGHTDFTTARGSFSYDRVGVDDSFYVDADDTVADVDEKVRAQVAKVAEARERHLTSESVPFVGHVVTPERKAAIAATLRGGKVHSFRPSGFGTGYDVSVRPRSRHAKRAPDAMAAFFGVEQLYYDTTDCD